MIKMIGKNWKVIEEYKDMLIYEKNGVLHFGNKSFSSIRAKNLRSAKNRITRYINNLSDRQRNSLKYLKYQINNN